MPVIKWFLKVSYDCLEKNRLKMCTKDLKVGEEIDGLISTAGEENQ